jgi:hypothetical protein
MNLPNLKEKSDFLPTLSRYPRPTPVQNAKDHLSAEREQFIYYAYKSKPIQPGGKSGRKQNTAYAFHALTILNQNSGLTTGT